MCRIIKIISISQNGIDRLGKKARWKRILRYIARMSIVFTCVVVFTVFLLQMSKQLTEDSDVLLYTASTNTTRSTSMPSSSMPQETTTMTTTYRREIEEIDPDYNGK